MWNRRPAEGAGSARDEYDQRRAAITMAEIGLPEPLGHRSLP
jgi:hypothetical protein